MRNYIGILQLIYTTIDIIKWIDNRTNTDLYTQKGLDNIDQADEWINRNYV